MVGTRGELEVWLDGGKKGGQMGVIISIEGGNIDGGEVPSKFEWWGHVVS